MTAESLFALAICAAVVLVIALASMAAGWALRSRQYAEDMKALDKANETCRGLRGHIHELTDTLALEQRVVAGLGEHLSDDTVREVVDSITGATHGRREAR